MPPHRLVRGGALCLATLLMLLLLASCEPFFTREELDRVTHRGYLEVTYRQWWQREADSWAAGGDASGQKPMFHYGILPPHQREHTPMPNSVRHAWRFYASRMEPQGRGVVDLSHFVLNEDDELWVVRATTPNDDGWIELYNEEGQWLEAGRSATELIAWIESEAELPALRAQVETGALPEALADRWSRTLWRR